MYVNIAICLCVVVHFTHWECSVLQWSIEHCPLSPSLYPILLCHKPCLLLYTLSVSSEVFQQRTQHCRAKRSQTGVDLGNSFVLHLKSKMKMAPTTNVVVTITDHSEYKCGFRLLMGNYCQGLPCACYWLACDKTMSFLLCALLFLLYCTSSLIRNIERLKFQRLSLNIRVGFIFNL